MPLFFIVSSADLDFGSKRRMILWCILIIDRVEDDDWPLFFGSQASVYYYSVIYYV